MMIKSKSFKSEKNYRHTIDSSKASKDSYFESIQRNHNEYEMLM